MGGRGSISIDKTEDEEVATYIKSKRKTVKTEGEAKTYFDGKLTSGLASRDKTRLRGIAEDKSYMNVVAVYQHYLNVGVKSTANNKSPNAVTDFALKKTVDYFG
jgi:hypothetical protein